MKEKRKEEKGKEGENVRYERNNKCTTHRSCTEVFQHVPKF